MILAMDVGYDEERNRAIAACVGFIDWADPESTEEWRLELSGVSPYVPGAFYKRELPCLHALIAKITSSLDAILVDGYVDVRPGQPGLGRHLYEDLGGHVPIVGVAKTAFDGNGSVRIKRGQSDSPLYVTAAGVDVDLAAEKISSMHGPYRIPTLLKRVDALSRQGLRLP